MIPQYEENDWDFTAVIALNDSLSIGGDETVRSRTICTPGLSTGKRVTAPAEDPVCEEQTGLGHFPEIWKFLGQPLHVPPPTTPFLPESVDSLEIGAHGNQIEYRRVKWHDEIGGGDLADNDEICDSLDLLGLTKSQRKKARRKKLRQVLSPESAQNGRLPPSDSEKEPEITQAPRTQDRQHFHAVREQQLESAPAPRTPDRRAVIHQEVYGRPEPDTGHLRSGKVFRPQLPIDHGAWPVAAPHSAKQLYQTLIAERESPYVITAAKSYASAATIKAKLISILSERFIDEREYLRNVNIVQYTSGGKSRISEGIHVFVDASNIMIGFHDALKLSRGQSLSFRMRRQPLSFHNLSLILERGRPTAKRIVVGSDKFPAMQEAKQIGYETNILDRVHKAKELTPRQKRYSNSNGGISGGLSGSGSETIAAVAQYAPEKWVEQAVDEILHLKMMESVVDASEPSVMVLATGDAAEAEYSEGFLKMVERALGKGWKVELASFKHNTSHAYRRKEFRQKWGNRFKTVELDEFVELLLGVE